MLKRCLGYSRLIAEKCCYKASNIFLSKNDLLYLSRLGIATQSLPGGEGADGIPFSMTFFGHSNLKLL